MSGDRVFYSVLNLNLKPSISPENFIFLHILDKQQPKIFTHIVSNNPKK